MKYDFDNYVERKHTDCVKWDSLIEEFGENDIIPMGIADMDFLTFPKISEALVKRAQHGVFGYTTSVDGILKPHIYKHYAKKGYMLEESDITVVTGVIYALDLCVKLFTKPNDKILLASPYYPPHRSVIESNDRVMVETAMMVRDDKYVLDMEDIRAKADDSVKMFILCHPHNPTGRIFSEEEIKEIADLCEQKNIMIISDEIHSDFAMFRDFVPAMNISEYIRNQGITVTSLTKTFSLSGLKVAYCFIHNEELRERFNKACGHTGIKSVNIFGIEACKAALDEGEQWEREVVDYLRENSNLALEYFRERIPSVKAYVNEGTYVIWLDMRESGLDLDNLNRDILDNARVQLNNGDWFGARGFQRMNVACPRFMLLEALKRLEKYVNKK